MKIDDLAVKKALAEIAQKFSGILEEDSSELEQCNAEMSKIFSVVKDEFGQTLVVARIDGELMGPYTERDFLKLCEPIMGVVKCK